MRLIDADALKEIYRKRFEKTLTDKSRGIDLSKYAEPAINAFNELIDNMPTVQAVPIPENATRKEVHLLIFGIEPPELDSPYYACARSNGGCNACKHKDDTDCDYNWWNAPYWYRESISK